MSPLQPWGTRERFISLRFRYQLTVNRAEKYCRQYPGGDDMICSQNCIVPSTPGIWIWLALPNFTDFIFTFLARKCPSLLQLEVRLGSVVYYTELKISFSIGNLLPLLASPGAISSQDQGKGIKTLSMLLTFYGGRTGCQIQIKSYLLSIYFSIIWIRRVIWTAVTILFNRI